VPLTELDVMLVAPVPVGHRVRVTFYVTERRGLFGGSREELPHEPVVQDLDSGVVYCSERPFVHENVKRPYVPLAVESTPRGTVDRVVEGVVRGCRVLTVRGFSEIDVQTRLLVEG
jgi:hypothetical protein